MKLFDRVYPTILCSRKNSCFWLFLLEDSSLPSILVLLSLGSFFWSHILFIKVRCLFLRLFNLIDWVGRVDVEKNPPTFMIIVSAKNAYVQNIPGGFFTSCIINVHICEKPRCICQVIFCKFSLTLVMFIQDKNNFSPSLYLAVKEDYMTPRIRFDWKLFFIY